MNRMPTFGVDPSDSITGQFWSLLVFKEPDAHGHPSMGKAPSPPCTQAGVPNCWHVPKLGVPDSEQSQVLGTLKVC